MALTPEQIALLQAGAEEVYDPNLRAKVLAGELPVEALNPRGATPMGPRASSPSLEQRVRGAGRQALGRGQEFLNTFMQGAGALPVGRIGLAAGMVAPAMTALSEAQQSRPTGAIGALGGGALGAAGGMAVGKLALGGLAAAPGIAGVIGKVGQAALPVLGGMLGAPMGAQGLESAKRSFTGEPTTGKEDELKNQLAARGQILNQDLSALDRTYGVNLRYMRDLARDQANQDFLTYQRFAPEIEKAKNNELVRQQALNAHMAQQQAMLGTLATAGALARGAQQETGANLRTALTSAPYAGSVLQAPQIRFG